MQNLVVLNRGTVVDKDSKCSEEIIYSRMESLHESVFTVIYNLNTEEMCIVRYKRDDELEEIAKFRIEKKRSDLVDIEHLMDIREFVFVFSDGEIYKCRYGDKGEFIFLNSGQIRGKILGSKWSPDKEHIVVYTEEGEVMMLTRDFYIVFKENIETNVSKTSAHVSVGWGSEEHQFRGKGSRLRDPTVVKAEEGILSRNDEKNSVISWRWDNEFFVISSISRIEKEEKTSERRVMRVFNREGNLISVSEPLDGLELKIAWRNQHFLIACTSIRIVDGEERFMIVFFEKNGLKHSEFDTKANTNCDKILDLNWSSNGQILMLQFTNKTQLWTTKNHYWYLKQELFCDNLEKENELVYGNFHPVNPFKFLTRTRSNEVSIYTIANIITTGICSNNKDSALNLVIDGSFMRMTPFALYNIPPPMFFNNLFLNLNINICAASKSSTKFAFLTSTNMLLISVFSSPNFTDEDIPNTKKIDITSTLKESNFFSKQIAFINDQYVLVLSEIRDKSLISIFDVTNVDNIFLTKSLHFQSKLIYLRSSVHFDFVVVETIQGELDLIRENFEIERLQSFSQPCSELQSIKTIKNEEETILVFGLTFNLKLLFFDLKLESGITSFKIVDNFLIYTQNSSIHFVDLDELNIYYTSHSDNDVELMMSLLNKNVRTIEKGSIIVNVIAYKCCVILQAPRGNLETIYPRVMVLSMIHNDLLLLNYKNAFVNCKKFKIEFDVIYDYDPITFLKNAESFINQINDSDDLDLFICNLHDEKVSTQHETKDQTYLITDRVRNIELSNNKDKIHSSKNRNMNKVTKICECFLSILHNSKYIDKFSQVIITCNSLQKPKNLVKSLEMIKGIEDQKVQQKLLKHLCFLSDTDELYNETLGLYHIETAFSVAQLQQRDPKEYVSFLKNLNDQPQHEREFLIDNLLKKYDKALVSLYKISGNDMDTFYDYIVKHGLYQSAMKLCKYDENKFTKILELYGVYLTKNKEFNDAALIYQYIGDYDRALENNILNKNWKRSLELSLKSELSHKFKDICIRLIESLKDKKNYIDAAEIHLNFLSNVEDAIELYCKAADYESAMLTATKYKMTDLIPKILDTSLNEGFTYISELILKCSDQFVAQFARLCEIRSSMKDNLNFYEEKVNCIVSDHISVAETDLNSNASIFTKYTNLSEFSARTGDSRKTLKNSKRNERKQARGKKDSMYEEEYLMNSLGRLIQRLNDSHSEISILLEYLIIRKKIQQAHQIQSSFSRLLLSIEENILDIYLTNEDSRKRFDKHGNCYYIPEIPLQVLLPFVKKKILDF